MAERLPVVLRTDTTPARLQEMPLGDLLPKSVLSNALPRSEHTGPLNWAWSVYGGTSNVITLAPVFARAAYSAGDELRFRATATNTGATTINLSGLGAKAAVTVTGVALPSGYIRTDVDTVCVYDGTRFVVSREVEQGSTASGTYVLSADGTLEMRAYQSAAGLSIAVGGSYAGEVLPAIPLPVAPSGLVFKTTSYGASNAAGTIPAYATLSDIGGPSYFQCSLLNHGPITIEAVSFNHFALGKWY